MAFEIRKIGDVGAGHPVVARLGAQTAELIGFLDVDQKSRDEIGHLYAITLKDRLLRCHAFRNELVTKANTAIEEVQQQGDPRIRHVPNVVGLQGIAEGFLQEAKNLLRDLLEILRIAYGCQLRDASDFTNLKDDGDSKVVKWATATFGDDDPLTKLLKTEGKWIVQIIRARNAVEHPGGHSGTLTINNIRTDPKNPDAYIPPTWQRTGCPESGIVADMDVYLHNMLTLAEDLLVLVIKNKSKSAGLIDFIELPEDQRDPKCPIRLRAVLKREIVTQIIGKRKLTAVQRKEQQAQYRARVWREKTLLRDQDRAWREKKKREA